MSPPLDTLLGLNNAVKDLDMVQAWINQRREREATDQLAQLELDRQQTEVDHRRARIELAKHQIASSN